MKYYAYVIYSKLKKKSYTGITIDLDRRLNEHNRSHSSVRWTHSANDFDYLFCTELEDRETARLIEKYLKSGIGRDFKRSLLKKYLEW